MSLSIATATLGGRKLASFGSGDSGGRLQRRSGGRGGNANASRGEISAVRRKANRAMTTDTARRRILREIDSMRNNRGNINRRRLAALDAQLNATLGLGSNRDFV